MAPLNTHFPGIQKIWGFQMHVTVPSFTQPVMDAYRNLEGGGAGSILREVWGVVSWADYLGGWGGGVDTKEKSPDFRCPKVGISDSCACMHVFNGHVIRITLLRNLNGFLTWDDQK